MSTSPTCQSAPVIEEDEEANTASSSSLSNSPHPPCSSSSPPTLIILYGFPGCGKLTTANVLATMLPNYKLFHNHVVINMLRHLFDFGTSSYQKFREQIWFDLMCEAGRNGDSVIFTFCTEMSAAPDLLDRLKVAYEEAGAEGIKNRQRYSQTEEKGRVIFVHLHCELETLRQRLPSQSRKDGKKLVSVEFFDQLLERGMFELPLPSNPDVELDVTNSTPEENAIKTCKSLSL